MASRAFSGLLNPFLYESPPNPFFSSPAKEHWVCNWCFLLTYSNCCLQSSQQTLLQDLFTSTYKTYNSSKGLICQQLPIPDPFITLHYVCLLRFSGETLPLTNCNLCYTGMFMTKFYLAGYSIQIWSNFFLNKKWMNQYRLNSMSDMFPTVFGDDPTCKLPLNSVQPITHILAAIHLSHSHRPNLSTKQDENCIQFITVYCRCLGSTAHPECMSASPRETYKDSKRTALTSRPVVADIGMVCSKMEQHL